jgi:hypothetical protein
MLCELSSRAKHALSATEDFLMNRGRLVSASLRAEVNRELAVVQAFSVGRPSELKCGSDDGTLLKCDVILWVAIGSLEALVARLKKQLQLLQTLNSFGLLRALADQCDNKLARYVIPNICTPQQAAHLSVVRLRSHPHTDQMKLHRVMVQHPCMSAGLGLLKNLNRYSLYKVFPQSFIDDAVAQVQLVITSEHLSTHCAYDQQ